MATQPQLTARSRYRVPILDRALALVELLGGYPEGPNVTEMGEAVTIPKNSVFRIAVTLEGNGYLERLDPSKRSRFTSEFATHLRQVWEGGYGFDLSEEMEGQYCIGAPVFDGRAYPIAATWITAPSSRSRFPDSELDGVARRIRAAADLISGRFGWNPSMQAS